MSLQPVARAADDRRVDGGLQAFDTWMNGGGPLYMSAAAVVYLAIAPVFVLVHELGHAAVALMRTEGRVQVQVGKSPAAWHFHLGRLDFGLNAYLPRTGGAAGFAKYSGRVDPYSRIAFTLAGSTASGLFSALVVYLALRAHVILLVWVGAMGVLHSVQSLVPRRIAGAGSDGAAFLDAVRRLRRGPTAEELLLDMRCRWLALFKDVQRTLGPIRGRVLDGLPPALGHPGTGPDAVALWKLAFAGWCWRVVEGCAPGMRESALDALHTATRSGDAEPQLTFAAACSLAERESAAGFVHMPVELRATEADESKQRFAFQFGVALYDIERARGSVE
jgi:hypothetical protein